MGILNLIAGGYNFAEILMGILSTLAVVFLTMPIHEFAHAFTATKLGDPTPRYQGRLTLNPFAHIDWLGSLFIILLGIGYAKPVSVSMHNFRNPKRDMAITAAAGPISNLLVAFISLFLAVGFSFASSFGVASVVFSAVSFFFNYVAIINISLAIFNLIPVPPFDGSRILSAFLPDKYYYSLMRYERYILFAVMALLYIGVFDTPLYLARSAIYDLFLAIVKLPFSLFIR